MTRTDLAAARANLSIFDVQREGVELTLQSLLAYWPRHEHVAIAGGSPWLICQRKSAEVR